MSVTTALAPYCRAPHETLATRVGGKLGLRARPGRFETHIPYWRLYPELPRRVTESYFKFAFVRNPWDRQVSLYRYILDRPGHHLHAELTALGSFEAYIRRCAEFPPENQLGFIDNTAGRVMMDRVGRFENLAEDFNAICERIGVRARLPRVNASARGPWRDYYDRETFELVRRMHAADIEAFGYDESWE